MKKCYFIAIAFLVVVFATPLSSMAESVELTGVFKNDTQNAYTVSLRTHSLETTVQNQVLPMEQVEFIGIKYDVDVFDTVYVDMSQQGGGGDCTISLIRVPGVPFEMNSSCSPSNVQVINQSVEENTFVLMLQEVE